MRRLLALATLLLAGCATAAKPADESFWYRIYKVDHETGERIGKEYTCFQDGTKPVKCWEEQ